MMALMLYRNPRIMLLVISVIVVAGLSALALMPRLEDPVLGKRVGIITTVLPGESAARVEALVSIKLEQQLHNLAQIAHIRSTSRTGISILMVQLQDDTYAVDPVWSTIRDRLSETESELPNGCLAPKLEVFPMKAYAAILAVQPRSQDVDLSTLSRLTKQLATRISNLPGTESLKIFGDPGEEIVVEIPAPTLATIPLPTAAIASQLSTHNSKLPAGRLPGSNPLVLDVQREGVDAQRELEDTLIQFPGGRAVPLADIATVSKTPKWPATEFSLDDEGRHQIVIGAHVDDRVRVDLWGRKLRNTIDQFETEFQSDAEVAWVCAQDDYIAARLDSLLQNLLLGGFAVVAVVFVLMGWRSTVVVGASLPLSAAMVFAGLRALEIPLHQMSVTGLIVALGLLIDNAIVIVDEVRTRITDGLPIENAITQTIHHLKMPLFGSTLTTALAFMPIATLPGPPGEFVGTIAVSVIIAIGSSFLLAMTIVPASLAILKINTSSRSLLERGLSVGLLAHWYRRSLSIVFRFPILGVLIGTALPITGFLVSRQLPEQFFPPSQRNQIQIEVELPASESIEQTLASVRNMNQHVLDDASVESAHWFGGRSAPTFYYNVVPRRQGSPFYAQAIVTLSGPEPPDMAVQRLQNHLDTMHAECRVIVRQLEQGPPFDAPIELRIVGPDTNSLKDLSNKLRLILSQTKHVIHTRSDIDETVPKLTFNVDRKATATTGIADSDLSQFLYTTIEGAPAGEMLDGDRLLPVKVRMAREDRSDRLGQIAALPISVANHSNSTDRMRGGSLPIQSGPAAVPISAITNTKLTSDYGSITRIDGLRTAEVKAYIESGVLPSVVLNDFRKRLDDNGLALPNGYKLEFGGERAERSSAVNALLANAVFLFGLMVLALVVSFRSFRAALIVILVGALATGLGPLALWTFQFPFGFMAIVGTMGLVGVAINDSIVVLAAIYAKKNGCRNPNELVEVVMGCTRHILATTFTTILGFTPLILGGGGFWPPLAICIAAGVGGATLIALYLVPSFYLLLNRR